MISLDEVGAFAAPSTGDGVDVRFGIYLPGIDPNNGYELLVRVIHKADRFDASVETLDFPLSPVPNTLNNLWQAKVTIPLQTGTHFGQPGTYLYRYQLRQTLPGTTTPQVITTWFTDPFARITDVGRLSAFVTADSVPDFTWEDAAWKVPELEHLIVYELHVEEFGNNFDGIVERLPHFKSLGVTCLELMPVTSQKHDFDWGYGPLHYFAPNQNWGGTQGLKRLVNACHTAGIAVILDVVYQHVDPNFPYHLVYANANLPSPMIGGGGPFGPQIDYGHEFAHEYVQAANLHWLQEYHVDGFRYDEVADFYDGPTGSKYARMAYEIYNVSLTIPRFTPSGGTTPGEFSRIIQVPEALNCPQEILRATYSNGAWQDGLLNKSEDMAVYNYVDDAFVHQLDANFSGYPISKTVHDIANKPVDMPVAPFQYLESHDHSQLICFVGGRPGAGPFADRTPYYKLQPFAIALYTCQGIPMLWQGQEFAQNYILPDSGDGRVRFDRKVDWEYFYDECGVPLVRLYRILGTLRQKYPALRSRDSFYYNTDSRPGEGIVAYRRQSAIPQQIAMVFLNFSDHTQAISVPFPEPGAYHEMIDHDIRATPFDIAVDNITQPIRVDVPANYGYIFVKAG